MSVRARLRPFLTPDILCTSIIYADRFYTPDLQNIIILEEETKNVVPALVLIRNTKIITNRVTIVRRRADETKTIHDDVLIPSSGNGFQ